MFRSNWRYVLAALGFIAASLLGYASYQLYQASEQQRTQYHYQPAKETRGVVVVPRQPNPKGYQPDCENPQGNTNADLCAQWSAVDQVVESNRLASLNVRLSLIASLLTFLGTVFVGWTLLETRTTARRELRAYVLFKAEVSSPLYRRVEAMVTEYRMTIRNGFLNTGQTPAKHFRMTVRSEIVEPNPPEAMFHVEIVSEATRSTVGAQQDTMGPRDILLTHEEYEDLLSGKREFFLFGVGEYFDVFGSKHTVRFRRRMYKGGGFGFFYAMATGEQSD